MKTIGLILLMVFTTLFAAQEINAENTYALPGIGNIWMPKIKPVEKMHGAYDLAKVLCEDIISKKSFEIKISIRSNSLNKLASMQFRMPNSFKRAINIVKEYPVASSVFGLIGILITIVYSFARYTSYSSIRINARK